MDQWRHFSCLWGRIVIFKINNPLGVPSYIFTDLNTVAPAGVDAIFGTAIVADEKLREVREKFLQHEDYRFSIALVQIVGSDSIWSAVDPNKSSPEGDYRIFNHKIGQYEVVATLSECLARKEVLKRELAEELQLYTLEQVDEIPHNISPIKVTVL